MVSKHTIALVLRRLAKQYKTKTALETLASQREDAFQVLIATMLSARTRDEVTSAVSESLFSVYATPKSLANAPLEKIRKLIKPINFYKGKAKRIREVARIIHTQYRDKVPKTMEALDALPGVGRKIAGCVLVYAYGKSFIPTDSHVHQISNRLGWVKTKTPEETEQELMKMIPKRRWRDINNLFVLFGKQVCLPRNPQCRKCTVKELCPSRRR